ncbi:hypothetical protein WJX82_008326 [Trebouxia sp. C0006]
MSAVVVIALYSTSSSPDTSKEQVGDDLLKGRLVLACSGQALSWLLVTIALFLLERAVLQRVSAKLRSSESYQLQAGRGLDS